MDGIEGLPIYSCQLLDYEWRQRRGQRSGRGNGSEEPQGRRRGEAARGAAADLEANIEAGSSLLLANIWKADLLARYGGVSPRMAEEAHALMIDQVVQKALDDVNLSGSDLSAVVVTVGPGLSLCLRSVAGKAHTGAVGLLELDFVGSSRQQLSWTSDLAGKQEACRLQCSCHIS